MTIDHNTLVSFDSSCLIAAAGSPSGGSGFLLSLCAKGYLKAAVSQPVLLEAQSNIAAKLGDQAIKRFQNLLAITPLLFSFFTRQNKTQAIGESDKQERCACSGSGPGSSCTFSSCS